MTARLQHRPLLVLMRWVSWWHYVWPYAAYVPADAHMTRLSWSLDDCPAAWWLDHMAAYTPADAHNACALVHTSQLMLMMRLSCLLDDCPAAAYIPADAHDTLVLVYPAAAHAS